jgi:hypothetical protein
VTRRRLRVALVAGIAAVLGVSIGVASIVTSGGGPTTSGPCPKGWSAGPRPTSNFVPRSVDDGASATWLVGGGFIGGHNRAIAVRLAAGAWRSVDVPGGGPSYNVLDDVAATGPGSAWAVGSYFDRGRVGRTLIEKWNGKRWRLVEGPRTGGGDAELLGVAAGSPGRVWAVGSVIRDGRQAALIERWNGTAWRIERLPALVGSSSLNDVVSTGTDAWALGSLADARGIRRPLLMRWNGKRWKPAPAPGVVGSIASASASADGDVWAIGSSATTSDLRPLVLHWDGSAWQTVTPPSMGGRGALTSVSVAPDGHVWISGWWADAGRRRGFVAVREQSTWRPVPLPAGAGFPEVIWTAGSLVWVAGVREDVGGPASARLLRCAT